MSKQHSVTKPNRRNKMQCVPLVSICWVTRAVFSGDRILFTLFLASVCMAAIAQKDPKSNPPKYDLHTEIKIKATVEEVKLPPKGSEKEAAHLLVKTGADTLDVYLCPKSFLVDMGVSFGKGDEIALTGSKIKQGEADLVLAREVVKGTDTLVLRDDKGNPVWTWHR